MEWDPNHFRLFIGDLGNDVNDEDLIKAFGPDKGWKSFVKAKVIRDKVTQKTRGYGFVSYSDPEDFMAGEQFRDVRRIRENC
jgi:RNA recognition motif-containing protein